MGAIFLLTPLSRQSTNGAGGKEKVGVCYKCVLTKAKLYKTRISKKSYTFLTNLGLVNLCCGEV